MGAFVKKDDYEPGSILDAVKSIIFESLGCNHYGALATWLLDQGCTASEAIGAVKASDHWGSIALFAKSEGDASAIGRTT